MSKEESADGLRLSSARVPKDNGGLQPAQLVSQQVTIQISGIVARVAVEQHLVNTSESWIEAIYVFPLPDESSVDHLQLQVGERASAKSRKRKRPGGLAIHGFLPSASVLRRTRIS